MWMTLQKPAPAPVVMDLANSDESSVSTAQTGSLWDDEGTPGRHESEWTTRPRGNDWPGVADPANMEGPQDTANYPRAGGQIMHDNRPPEDRAQTAAARRFPRFVVKGDAARRDPRRPNLEYQAGMPDWADKGLGGRQLRDNVTTVPTPNPGGRNPDWAGVMTDPADQFLRDPAIGDWWV